MTPRSHSWMALLAAATVSAGATPPSVFPQGTPPGNAPPLQAVGGWGVSPGSRPVSVRWDASPFRHEENEQTANARLTLSASGGSGPIATGVVQSQDQTDLASGQETASVSATASGQGVAFFSVAVEIEGDNLPAGTYGTVVDVTVSAL